MTSARVCVEVGFLSSADEARIVCHRHGLRNMESTAFTRPELGKISAHPSAGGWSRASWRSSGWVCRSKSMYAAVDLGCPVAMGDACQVAGRPAGGRSGPATWALAMRFSVDGAAPGPVLNYRNVFPTLSASTTHISERSRSMGVNPILFIQ
jgi:hypothetical protein